MVFVQLYGGMGNQMFQYAAARSVAAKRGEDVLLYTGTPRFETPHISTDPVGRYYSLDVFDINGRLTNIAELRDKYAGVIWTIMETGIHFCPEVLSESTSHQHLALVGFWQSHKYFQGIEPILREELKFKRDYKNPHNPVLLDAIEGEESVCVHVRRTDYLDAQDTKGFVGSQYYERAITIVKARVNAAKFFVFSDDIAWCKENLTFLTPATFVDPANSPARHAGDDFYLMSRCKHFVIANSTYSWWAAWLADVSNNLVIAPQRWFRAEERDQPNGTSFTSSDLIPNNWLRA